MYSKRLGTTRTKRKRRRRARTAGEIELFKLGESAVMELSDTDLFFVGDGMMEDEGG